MSVLHVLSQRSNQITDWNRKIDSSPEKEDSKRDELELTPPPELSETKKAEIAQAVQ